ncbi:protein DMP6-like, partial [Oryza glaberrima]
WLFVIASRPSGSDEESPEAKALLLTSSDDGQTMQPLAQATPSLVCKALNSTADLAKHLPTSVVLAFGVLSPSSTADGSCTAANRALTACLVGACALCCFLLCFSNSYRDGTGAVRYDFVTPSGRLRLIDGSGSLPPRDNRYRLGARDVLHGALSFAVFLAVAMVDHNVVAHFYPVESPATRQLLAAVPMAAGVVDSFLFTMFPSTCRCIGFPVAAGARRHTLITTALQALRRVHTDRVIELHPQDGRRKAPSHPLCVCC